MEFPFKVYLLLTACVISTLSGAEALVRWNHPKKGLLSPNKFIPIFEQNGFIRMLDYAVFKQVCQWMRKQLDQQLPICPISVNISRVDLFNSRLCDSLLRLTEQYNLAPTLLRLEITESEGIFRRKNVRRIK